MTIYSPVGRTLHDAMRAMTWREYRTRIELEKRKWPEPGPIDRVTADPVLYFLARIAQRVQQVLSKEPNRILLDDQFVILEKPKEPLTEEEKAEAVKQEKGMWKGILKAFGGKIKYKTRPKNG